MTAEAKGWGGVSLKSNPARNPSHYLPNASGWAADNGPNIALMYYSTIDGARLKNCRDWGFNSNLAIRANNALSHSLQLTCYGGK